MEPTTWWNTCCCSHDASFLGQLRGVRLVPYISKTFAYFHSSHVSQPTSGTIIKLFWCAEYTNFTNVQSPVGKKCLRSTRQLIFILWRATLDISFDSTVYTLHPHVEGPNRTARGGFSTRHEFYSPPWSITLFSPSACHIKIMITALFTVLFYVNAYIALLPTFLSRSHHHTLLAIPPKTRLGCQ